MDSAFIFDYFVTSIAVSGQIAWIVMIFIMSLLGILGLRIAFASREHPSWLMFAVRFLFGFVPLAISALLLLTVISFSSRVPEWNLLNVIVATTSGLVAGILLAYYFGRSIEPRIIEFIQQKTRRAGLKDKLTDIRQVGKQFNDSMSIDFDYEFAKARANDEIFLGHDLEGNAVTISRKIWKPSHVQVMGPPGTGKGIQAGVSLTQSLLYGDAVFVFDPKDDEWAPSVYQAACERAGVSFEFIDLREPFPQINPILEASPQEVEEMLYAGFELGKKGVAADYYRLGDRKAARLAASFTENKALTLQEIGIKARSSSNTELLTDGKAFFTALDEISELKCVQTRKGINLATRLQGGGCVYIVGSMRNEPIITLQKMLFVRLIQLIEKSRHRNRHCSIFLDEFKYLLSKSAVNALGSIRDKGCNILLAHQSLGDFANCGNDLSESSVRTTVLDTTPIRWLYRPADYETAQWISNQTGQIMVATQSMQAMRNIELSESLAANRTVGEGTRNLFDVNTVQTMPKGCAVCIGAGLPKLARVDAIKVEKILPEIIVAEQADSESMDLLSRVTDADKNELDRGIWLPIEFDSDPKDIILKFLYIETWSHIDIVTELLSNISKNKVEEVLKDLVRERMIRSVAYDFLSTPDNEIWGITQHGLTQVKQSTGISDDSKRTFYKGRVSPTSFRHTTDIQRLRIYAERSGWINWKKPSRIDNLNKDGFIYPDAIATRPEGLQVAIEVERTLKSKKRYRNILVSHLHSRKQRYWDEIYYFCPDAQITARLKRLFSEISELDYFGTTVKVTDQHRSLFQIYTYGDNWT